MNRRVLILLTLAVVTLANAGCCARFRNWLHRGSRCGTTTVAPAMMGNPVALGTPYVAPQQMPTMAAPTMVPQMMAPQPSYECIPQCIPMCPPQCMPCPDMCSPYGGHTMSVPCDEGSWSGGYIQEGSSTGVPIETYEGGAYDSGAYPSDSGRTYNPTPSGGGVSPGPVEGRTNYPPKEQESETTEE